MKLETFIGITLLALFGLAMTFGGELAASATYFCGCLSFGWFIPNWSRYIASKIKKEDV